MHYQFAVDRGIKQTKANTQVHKFGRLPWPCGRKINKEIEESKHKWGSTLPSLTIHFPITEGDAGAQWSPSVSTAAQNGSRHQQQYSFTFRLSHTNRDAGRHWPPTPNSLSHWGKWKITHFSPVDSFQFHLGADLVSYTHQACLWDQIPRKKKKKKCWKWRESTGVNRKMCPWEAGEPWPGSAHPHRLWLDIWSRSRWNVRRVMTGMVIGRLWLTPDLEVLKGHSSLNRHWADALSNHGKVSEPDENTGKVLSHMSVSEQIFKTGLYSWKQSSPPHLP